MLKLDVLPIGVQEMLLLYGAPGKIVDDHFEADRTWVQENLKRFKLSFPLRQSWDHKVLRSFPAHRLVGNVMVEALEEIHDYYGLTVMRRYGLDLWGGVYNPRFKRNSTQPSTHAWAIAIDYCPDLGPYGKPSRIPWPIHDAFTKRGFVNLDFDSMHFQAVENY